MNNVLLWIGGILVAMLFALFAVPHFIDWTRYRGVFEEEASRVLGREVRVSGAVNLRLLPTPFVRFEKVRLSDAAGQTGEPFFRADDFTLWLAPAPLLRGAVEAREVELRRPVVKLRLNADGGGNWQTLSIARGQLPFIPSDVALQSVLITDGTISVDGADGRELARVGAINGELSVAALDGPFRFKGAFDWAGGLHEIKASTTAFDADGSLKFKAQMAVLASANTYTLDGRLADLSGKVKLDGQLTGQLGFTPGELGLPEAGPSAANSNASKPARIPVELRAAVAANTKVATFTDLGLSFEQAGKPQLVSGGAQVTWHDGFEVKSEWAARWLDLDEVLGRTGAAQPLLAVRHLVTAMAGLVPATGRGSATVSVDQFNLGGDALSDARLRIERDSVALRLSEFRVSLPGGTRAQLSGVFPQGAAADVFDGDISLRGASLARLMTWAGQASAVPEGRSEGAFSLRAKIGFEPQAVVVKDASASVGEAVLSGGVSYRWAERSRLDIVLEGDDIDLTLVSPHALDLFARARELGGMTAAVDQTVGKPAPKSKTESASRYKIDPQTQDVTLRIRAARVHDAARDLQDVDVDAALIGGRLSLRRMHFTNGTGLELDADGEIAEVGVRSQGTLRGTLSVVDAAAVSDLLELFGVSGDSAQISNLRAATPARVAWTAKLTEARAGGPGRAEVWLDGMALGRRLVGTAKLDGGLLDWRQHPVQMNVAIERPDWLAIGRLLKFDSTTPGTKQISAVANAATNARGKLMLSASGQPDQGLSAYLKIEDETFDVGVSGKVTLGAGKIVSSDGELQLRTSDTAQAFTVLGMPTQNLPGIAIDGAVDLSFQENKLKITPSALDVAGAIVGGELILSRPNDRLRIDGRLTTSTSSIPRLLELIVDRMNGAVSDADGNVWPAASFNFSLLDRVEGLVRLEAGKLELAPGLGLARATVVAEFDAGKVDLRSVDGDVSGGKLTSRWLIEKAAAGANLSGNLKIASAQLDEVLGSDKTTQGLAGSASVTAVFNGRALSPRGLIAALGGKGEIEIAKSETGVPQPSLVRRIANEVLAGKREATILAVEQMVVAKLKTPDAKLGLGNRKLAFDFADGAIRVHEFKVETPDGSAINRTTIDLASLKIDSEWKLDERFDKTVRSGAIPGARSVSALPSIRVVFVGPVTSLGRIDPVVSVDGLVRELGVRRMELDVDELERLRRLDEARAKADADRLSAEVAARASAAAAHGLQPAAGPALIVVPPIAVPPQPYSAPRDGAGSTTANPAADEATSVADQPVSGETKRRSSQPNGLTSEPRQVPTSQRMKKSWMQDVFRGQGTGGN